ncbi:MAG TPA: ABC transporter permease [Vicinamibacteria bacterium]|nr:ABC transporter permease [Vicinamibacteria bacterium]
MSPKLLAVLRREYLERVRTKGFVIATVLGPLLMAAMMVVPALAARTGGKPLRIAVVDRGGSLRPAVEAALRDLRIDGKPHFTVVSGEEGPAAEGEAAVSEREAAIKKQVLDGRLDGYLLLPADAVETASASYYGRNVSNLGELRTLERRVSDVLVGRRLAGAGLDPKRVRDLTRELDLKTIRVSAGGEREDRGAAFFLSIILLMILYTSILMWGQLVMTSVIEEKGSRVVEVMASGLPPTQLLWGKLLGVGAAGLTQFLVWAASLGAISLLAAGPVVGSIKLPEVSPLVLVSFVGFFLLGFLFYASLYAAIGAAVNTVQEAQNFVFPVIMPLVVGLVCFPVVLESPDSRFSVALSLLPFLTPLMMFLRIVVLTPPGWQIAVSMVVLLLAIAAAVWFAARVYRVGILMYGKKPTFPELMRWVRHT